jgi:HSP20 family molecular chaperone IbpA
MPPTVDTDHITADLAAGVLTVTVPKRPEAGARRVEVS